MVGTENGPNQFLLRQIIVFPPIVDFFCQVCRNVLFAFGEHSPTAAKGGSQQRSVTFWLEARVMWYLQDGLPLTKRGGTVFY